MPLNPSDGFVAISKATPGIPLRSRKIARVLKSDIENEMKFWDNYVVCHVTSANPPSMLLKVLLEGFERIKRLIHWCG